MLELEIAPEKELVQSEVMSPVESSFSNPEGKNVSPMKSDSTGSVESAKQYVKALLEKVRGVG